MYEHKDYDAIAQEAATEYGQDWTALPPHAKEKWLNEAKTAVNVGLGFDETPITKALAAVIARRRAIHDAEVLGVNIEDEPVGDVRDTDELPPLPVSEPEEVLPVLDDIWSPNAVNYLISPIR